LSFGGMFTRGTFFPIRESSANVRGLSLTDRQPSSRSAAGLRTTDYRRRTTGHCRFHPVANSSSLPVTFGKWNIPAIAAKPRSQKALPSARTVARRRFALFPLKPSPSGHRGRLPMSPRKRLHRLCPRCRHLRCGHRVRPIRRSPPPFAGTLPGKALCCAEWAPHSSRPFLSSRLVAASGCSGPAHFRSRSIRSARRRR